MTHRIWVEGEITEASANTFIADVARCGSADIEVYVDSVGGTVDGALRMAACLQKRRGRIEMTLLKADSAALYLIMAGDHVVCARDASCLLHGAMADVRAGLRTRDELNEAAEEISDVERGLSRLLEARTGLPDTSFRMLAAKGKRLTAENLLAYHLVDSILPSPKSHLRQRQ